MPDNETRDLPRNLHDAITIGITRAHLDLGVNAAGCTPAMLTGHVIQELKRIPGWRPPAEPVGYITGYRSADNDWHVPFDGTPFATRDEAEADAQDAGVELPGVDWRALTVYDETGEPYRAGER